MVEALRNFLSRHLFSPLQGMTAGAWWSVLRRNRFAVDPRYWPRAAFQTAVSLTNEGFARWEDAAHGRTDDAGVVEAPLFILGHFRSGTTHLHNLLALDPQFAFPTLYQTLYPRSFRTTQAFIPRLGGFLLLRTRPHDNVALDFGVPNEDELAICADSGLSPYMGWVFPRHAEFYDRFWTFEEATADEIGRWKSSLVRFVAKLTADDNRPLVLKSPPHTGRIRLLLELFPDARFVHIRRDPYTVFRSTRHMYATTMRFWQLQVPASDDFDDRILRIYRAMYDAYFDQRDLIPEGRSCEIRYEDLEADPIGQVGSIYRALGLAGFASVRPRLEGYIDSIGGYRKNRHPELPEGLRRRISTEWRRCFEAWGYAAR